MRRLHYMRGCIMRARRSLSFVSATAVAWAICASAAAAQAADDPQTPTQVAQATAPGASAAQDSRFEIAQSENQVRSEEHTSELQSLMRISYAVFCLKKKKTKNTKKTRHV